MTTAAGRRAEFRTEGEVAVSMAAPAQRVYDLIADVERVGEWSPECRRAAWIDGASGPAVGARFRGWNRWKLSRWSRLCEVIEAEPGRSFAFRTVPGRGPSADSTVWRYDIAPSADGCVVTESYRVEVRPRSWFVPFIRRSMPHHFDMRPHMEQTLHAIKAASEAPRSGP